MHDPREVDPVPVAQRREHPRVELDLHAARQRPLHRTSGQLVPEGDRVRPHLQHPDVLGIGEHGDVAEQCPRQGQLDPRGHHGELLQRGLHRPVQRADPRENGVDDGRRHAVGTRGERFGDEERVACR